MQQQNALRTLRHNLSLFDFGVRAAAVQCAEALMAAPRGIVPELIQQSLNEASAPPGCFRRRCAAGAAVFVGASWG